MVFNWLKRSVKRLLGGSKVSSEVVTVAFEKGAASTEVVTVREGMALVGADCCQSGRSGRCLARTVAKMKGIRAETNDGGSALMPDIETKRNECLLGGLARDVALEDEDGASGQVEFQPTFVVGVVSGVG